MSIWSPAAFDEWEEDLLDLTLYDKSIGCVSKDGFDPNDVDPDEGVIVDIIEALGGWNPANASAEIQNVAQNLTTNDPNSGAVYQLIMDAEQTSLLVSGTDGYIYLAPKKEQYDLSAPWGTTSTDGSKLSMDTFGRIISYHAERYQHGIPLLAVMRVDDPKKMTKYNNAASIAQIKTEDNKYFRYNILAVDKNGKDMLPFYPTFCETSKGLRLYGTISLIDKDGIFREGPDGKLFWNRDLKSVYE